MTWWLRARLVLPGLAALLLAWVPALFWVDQFFVFPTLYGPRARVPLFLLLAMLGLIVLVYGLDRSRTTVELTATRPVVWWDAALVVSTALAAVVGGAVCTVADAPEALSMARATVTGLGAYLVARAVLRVELAALAPVVVLSGNAAVWDVVESPDTGPWLLAAPQDVPSWLASLLVLCLGTALFVAPRLRSVVH